jgi:hypothetical protein
VLPRAESNSPDRWSSIEEEGPRLSLSLAQVLKSQVTR